MRGEIDGDSEIGFGVGAKGGGEGLADVAGGDGDFCPVSAAAAALPAAWLNTALSALGGAIRHFSIRGHQRKLYERLCLQRRGSDTVRAAGCVPAAAAGTGAPAADAAELAAVAATTAP